METQTKERTEMSETDWQCGRCKRWHPQTRDYCDACENERLSDTWTTPLLWAIALELAVIITILINK